MTKGKPITPKSRVRVMKRLQGYTAVLLGAVAYSGGMITAQLLGHVMPRFELNILRFVFMMVVCALVCCFRGLDVWQVRAQSDIVLLLLGGTATTWTVLCMNTAPLYAPVGNLQSVGITVFIICNVLCAIFRRTATVGIVVAALMACLGVVFLSQPEFLFNDLEFERHHKDPCPCSTIQGDDISEKIEQCIPPNVAVSTTMKPSTLPMSPFIPIIDEFVQENITERLTDPLGSTPVPGLLDVAVENVTEPVVDIPLLPVMNTETYGFLLMISWGIAFFVSVQVSAYFLLPRYHVIVISLWYSVLGVIFSIVMMICLEHPRVVGGMMCMLFLVLHIVLAGGTSLLTNISLCFISASENAILNTTGIILLFIAQSTFLVTVHPTRGNLMEVFGAVLLILACLIDPILSLIAERRNKGSEEAGEEGEKNVEGDEETNEKTSLLAPTKSIQTERPAYGAAEKLSSGFDEVDPRIGGAGHKPYRDDRSDAGSKYEEASLHVPDSPTGSSTPPGARPE